MAERRERIPAQGDQLMSLENCWKIQKRHFLKDLLSNLVNTLWAIPYLSIRKVLEGLDKVGMEFAAGLLSKIPKSIKTEFQKEMERSIQSDFFGLRTELGERSDLAVILEHQADLKASMPGLELKVLIQEAEADIHQVVADFCTTRNGFTDLAASSGLVLVARRFFNDSSLNIIGISKRWAGQWARKDATSHFLLGPKLGKLYYQYAPAPPASSKEIFLATIYSIVILALFSTIVNILSYPVQNKLGFQKKQFQKLIQAVEDKLLLRFTVGR